MTQPNAHFRQHHDVDPPRIDADHFRPAWRVATRLEALRLDGAITDRECAAGVTFRNVWECAFSGTYPQPQWVRVGSSCGLGPERGSISRLDALATLHSIRGALGPFACRLLAACAVDDVSWAYLGRALGIDPKTARAWTIAALRALAVSGRLSWR